MSRHSIPTSTTVGKAFPTSIDNSKGGSAQAEPTLLGRSDMEHGKWHVEHCRAVRGEPKTNVANRVMYAPTDDDEKARAIRAHELMHAKVSPANDMDAWVGRQIASAQALIVTEELRVNYLCTKAGFDMSHLADGSETADGERMGATKDWAGCVATAVATAGTGANKLFLNGVRRHNREWGEILLKVSKRAVKEIKKADKERNLASTEADGDTGLSPIGFAHTERIAEWVDRLAMFPPPPEPPKKAKKAGDSKSGEGESPIDNSSSEVAHSNKGKSETGNKEGNPDLDKITPTEATRGIPRWGELRIERCPMPKYSKGHIGKKRIATNMGRRPRRMHRLLTDPSMRVFDRTVRGSGGMVILDASGSMSFTENQIAEILEHAPGATIAMYTDKGNEGTNMYIVADKGRMVEQLPDYGYGNGVDFPAIEWGVKNKAQKNSPLVWVTDGGVCGHNDGFHGVLAMQCLTYARKNKYKIVPHADEAIKQLKQLSNGGKARSVYPAMFRQVWREANGNELPYSE